MSYLNLGIDFVLFIAIFFGGFFFVVKVLDPRSPAATESGLMFWRKSDTSSKCDVTYIAKSEPDLKPS